MKRVTRKSSKTKTKRHTKKRHTKRKYRGGRLYTPEEAVMPFKSVGFNGSPTASIAAYNNSVTSAEKQYAMNKLSGGASSDTVEVPSFAPIGGLNLAYSSTELSRDSNLTNLIGDTDALNDKLVYEDIPKVNNAMGGTKRRRRMQMKGMQMKGIQMKKKRQIKKEIQNKKRTMRR